MNCIPYETEARRPFVSPWAACLLIFGKTTVATDVVKIPTGICRNMTEFAIGRHAPVLQPACEKRRNELVDRGYRGRGEVGDPQRERLAHIGAPQGEGREQGIALPAQGGQLEGELQHTPARTPAPMARIPSLLLNTRSDTTVAAVKRSGLSAGTVNIPCEFSTAMTRALRLTRRM